MKDVKDIIEIGVYDADLDKFENQYPTPAGVTYNSYLLVDDQIAVIDTVDSRKGAEWRKNLLAALPEGRTPDYLIVEHLEPDHSGEIAWLMTTFPQCRIICSKAAERMLKGVAGDPYEGRILTMADSQTLSTGHHELVFVTAPMVHWPEVMMVFDKSTGTLFSADAFGRFGHPADDAWGEEAARYYHNIVGKYGAQVNSLFKKFKDFKIERIAPLHGPVLTHDLKRYFDSYVKWASYEPEEPHGVLVAHASIHGFTARAAQEMAELLKLCGTVNVVTVDLTTVDSSYAVREAFRMGKMVVMASTYDGEIFTPMHDFLHRLALKGYRNRTVGIVENGLWAPQAAKKMAALLAAMPGVTIVEPMVTLRGRHTEDNILQFPALAQNLISDSES